MKTIPELEAELSGLVAELHPLIKRLETVRADLENERSKEFIRVNGITDADVQKDSGGDLPWFGTVQSLIAYIRNNNIHKPYTTWNGLLYLTSELLAGKFKPTVGRVEHIEGWGDGE